jgi:hypothetical protein
MHTSSRDSSRSPSPPRRRVNIEFSDNEGDGDADALFLDYETSSPPAGLPKGVKIHPAIPMGCAHYIFTHHLSGHPGGLGDGGTLMPTIEWTPTGKVGGTTHVTYHHRPNGTGAMRTTLSIPNGCGMRPWDINKQYPRPWPRFNPDPNATCESIPDNDTAIIIDGDDANSEEARTKADKGKRGRSAITLGEHYMINTLNMSPLLRALDLRIKFKMNTAGPTVFFSPYLIRRGGWWDGAASFIETDGEEDEDNSSNSGDSQGPPRRLRSALPLTPGPPLPLPPNKGKGKEIATAGAPNTKFMKVLRKESNTYLTSKEGQLATTLLHRANGQCGVMNGTAASSRSLAGARNLSNHVARDLRRGSQQMMGFSEATLSAMAMENGAPTTPYRRDALKGKHPALDPLVTMAGNAADLEAAYHENEMNDIKTAFLENDFTYPMDPERISAYEAEVTRMANLGLSASRVLSKYFNVKLNDAYNRVKFTRNMTSTLRIAETLFLLGTPKARFPMDGIRDSYAIHLGFHGETPAERLHAITATGRTYMLIILGIPPPTGDDLLEMMDFSTTYFTGIVRGNTGRPNSAIGTRNPNGPPEMAAAFKERREQHERDPRDSDPRSSRGGGRGKGRGGRGGRGPPPTHAKPPGRGSRH